MGPRVVTELQRHSLQTPLIALAEPSLECSRDIGRQNSMPLPRAAEILARCSVGAKAFWYHRSLVAKINEGLRQQHTINASVPGDIAQIALATLIAMVRVRLTPPAAPLLVNVVTIELL